MEAQIIRYRATRKFVFGALNIGELECFVMERRTTRLDAGAYRMKLMGNNVVLVGGAIVTRDGFESTDGVMSVGSYIVQDKLRDVEDVGKSLVKTIAKAAADNDEINLEIIDEANYDEADSELA